MDVLRYSDLHQGRHGHEVCYLMKSTRVRRVYLSVVVAMSSAVGNGLRGGFHQARCENDAAMEGVNTKLRFEDAGAVAVDPDRIEMDESCSTCWLPSVRY